MKSFSIAMGEMASLSHTWGTEPHERALAFPCDLVLSGPDDACYRGVTIQAPPQIVFRWLCQLRVAPYSYDWIDSLGRQSPRQLTPGLDDLAIGQEVMQIFELADFALNRHLTLRIKQGTLAQRLFGDVAVSYCVIANEVQTCRLLVKMLVQYPPRVIGRLARHVLPLGDLIMMRRQLLNFKKLAERTAGDVA
jgi:hypothetical protein